jgi:hypothetical protein
MRHQLIHIQPEAPPKPALGAACNGCGICCLAEPCPVGMLVSLRRRGACRALRWSDAERRYLCGMLTDPLAVLGCRTHRAAPLARLISAWCRRLISAGRGCDASLQIERPQPGEQGLL